MTADGRMGPLAGKRYFQHTQLCDIIHAYPYKSGLSDGEQQEQRRARDAFFDFLAGILVRGPSAPAEHTHHRLPDPCPGLSCSTEYLAL